MTDPKLTKSQRADPRKPGIWAVGAVIGKDSEAISQPCQGAIRKGPTTGKTGREEQGGSEKGQNNQPLGLSSAQNSRITEITSNQDFHHYLNYQ